MNERVSVGAAIWRGTWTVNGGVMATMIAPWLVTGLAFKHADFFALYLPKEVATVGGLALTGFSMLSIPLAWLWWSVAVPKWKLWAYSRVNDVDALKRRAIAAGLIWPDGHLFEKTELCSRATRQRIRALEGRP